jgi:hypothetical protein
VPIVAVLGVTVIPLIVEELLYAALTVVFAFSVTLHTFPLAVVVQPVQD